jgi:hypothetical protein
MVHPVRQWIGKGYCIVSSFSKKSVPIAGQEIASGEAIHVGVTVLELCQEGCVHMPFVLVTLA